MEKRSAKGPKNRSERNTLTFYEKIAVIRYYDETNISRNSLAKMFHCCATQIRRILEKKEELLQQLATLSEADASIIIEEMTRKRRKFEMSAISFILHQWVERCRQMRLLTSLTNQTLKETALKMAAVLNLPAFRPSYRWLNRFRCKYKYHEPDLGAGAQCAFAGDLSVEDIIIEFKDSLPSFMQKEITAITTSSKVDEKCNKVEKERTEVPSCDNERRNDEVFEDEEADEVATGVENSTERSQAELQEPQNSTGDLSTSCSEASDASNADNNPLDIRASAGTSALLNSVFPHLAVIHQFALLNSDIKALELISQLGVHMQTQAVEGAYKQLSLATANTTALPLVNASAGGIFADIDDIILIE